jgi:non-specific serine/threonine protein kinase
MLETVREYGLEQLAASGEEMMARDRHLAWCVALAEEAEPRLTGPEQVAWLARLEAEHDNLRAALGWARERGEGKMGLRLAGALWRFWWTHGHLSEGRRWLEETLKRGDRASAASRATALTGAGTLAWTRGDYAHATAPHEKCLVLRRALGDRSGIAHALGTLGNVAHSQGDYGRATTIYEECLAIRRALGDRQGIASALGNLGAVAYQQGESRRAVALQEESLALKRALGDTWGIAGSLVNLGNVAYSQGEYGRAEVLYEESLALFRELGAGRALPCLSTTWEMWRTDRATTRPRQHSSMRLSCWAARSVPGT